MLINQLVNTPIGVGRCQGSFDERVLVRLPVNDKTRDHLKQSNCLTPRAKQSGLWVFAKAELS